MYVHVGVHWLEVTGEFDQFCGFQLDEWMYSTVIIN